MYTPSPPSPRRDFAVDIGLVLLAGVFLIAALVVGGCAVPLQQVAGDAAPALEERLACSYELPPRVESGGPFPVAVTVENITRAEVLEVVTGGRNFLGLLPVPDCDAAPEATPASSPRPPAPGRRHLVVTALLPGQAVHRRFDLARDVTFPPGVCRFRALAVDLVEAGGLRERLVRCQPRPAAVEVVQASRALREPF